MTREIKFRAWDKFKKKWVTNLALLPDNELCIFDEDGGYTLMVNYQTLYDIQLFTGLLDKNGKEIYEGDIVRTFYGKVAVVMYLDGGFKLFTNTTDFKPIGTVIGQDVEENYLGYFFQENVEIIGNLYENPELLK